jgi:peptidoglycan/xylan/chitin deacetylase (PgdA/CDA1 family)
MLDLLDQSGVKATFFVTGNNRGKGHIDDSSTPWPTILRRMQSAGHQIASHTWTHRDLTQVNSTILKTEMIYNEMAFRNLFGWIPTYMRPPYLDCDATSGCLGLMKQLGYHVINTNLDTKDYEYDGPDLIQSAKDKYSAGVSSNSGSNNYIVLAHDVHEQTVHNLTSYMIQTARNRGYKLVTVGECLGDPKENWYRIVGSQPTQTQASTLVPQPTSTTQPLIISPNQRCGGTTGYTCMNSRFGDCCSWYGYW